MVALFVISVLMIRVLVHFYKKGYEEESQAVISVISGLTLIITTTVFLHEMTNLLQVYLAPKIYLITYLTQSIK